MPAPRIGVFGAAGFTGALAARLIDRHPTFQLAFVTARSDVGRRLDDLYPHHRVPLVLEELDLDRHADVDAAVVAYPHGAAAELVVELREARGQGRRSQRRLPAADPEVYGEWYREHPAPELIARGRVRPAGAVPRLAAWSGPGRQPGLLSDRHAAGPRAAGPRRADRRRRDRREVGCLRRGRAATDKTHFVTVDENVNAYGVPRHRHTPEIEQELAALGNAVTITFTPHLLPLDQGELVSATSR